MRNFHGSWAKKVSRARFSSLSTWNVLVWHDSVSPPPSLPSLFLSPCWALRFSEMKESRLRVQEGRGQETGQVQFFCVDCGRGPEQDQVSLTQVHQGSLCLIPCRMRAIYPRRGLPPQVCGKHVPPWNVYLPCRSKFPGENSSPPRWSAGLPSLADQRQALNCLTCLLQLVCRSPEVLGAAEERSGSPLLGNESAHMLWLWEMFLY